MGKREKDSRKIMILQRLEAWNSRMIQKSEAETQETSKQKGYKNRDAKQWEKLECPERLENRRKNNMPTSKDMCCYAQTNARQGSIWYLSV